MTISRRVSIGVQVWAMVLACLFLVGGFVAINTRADLQRDRQLVSSELSRRGEVTAGYLTSSLDPGGETAKALGSLGEKLTVTGLGASCNELLNGLQTAVGAGSLDVVDSRGKVLCSGLPAHLGKVLYADAPALLRNIAARATAIDAPITNPVSGQPGLFAAVPLKTSQTAALVYVSDTQVGLAPQGKSTSAEETLVVDLNSATILMRLPIRPGAVGSRILDPALSQALRAGGVTSAVGIDGVRRLYRQVPIGPTHFRLLIGVPEATAYAAARQRLIRNALFGAALILLLALFGYVLHRRLARPAHRLRRAIQAVGLGGTEPAPIAGPSELAELALAFNAMIDARERADGRFRAIVQNASDYLLVMDHTSQVTYVGPSAQTHLGIEVGDDGGTLLRLIHPDDRGRLLTTLAQWMEESIEALSIQLRTIDTAGVVRHLDVQGHNLLKDQAVGGVVLTCRDITERILFEQHLEHQARHDPLTGLPNRAAVLERLAELQSNPSLAVLYIDLDRFKLINDSHGHPVGDKVLVALGRELQSSLRPDDLVSRFGGDEFVVVAPGIGTAAAAAELAERVQLALAAPLMVEDRELFVSGSIGIAVAGPGDTPEGLLRHADTAMYRAKAQGRNCIAQYDDAMREEAVRLLRTETGLHRALERDQLILEYQPLFSLADGTLRGAEALVRWRHPEAGLLGPAEFIPVAEETGLIVPIGEWVLREACSWAAGVAVSGRPPLSVSVNVSARQLSQPDFLDLVHDVLLTSGLPSRLLCLELTETLLVQDAETASVTLTALSALGVRISIDDFGTGWSSLDYLRRFPVDEIKLDRSYVSAVTSDPATATIVASLVGMAHAMGLSVTAEGIETEEQLQFMRSTGCATGQGYLYARPTTPQRVEEMNGASLISQGTTG